MQHGTDGFVPGHMLYPLAGLVGSPMADPAAERLLKAELWDAATVDGVHGCIVHDYLEHQQSAEQIEAERRNAKERQRRARDKRTATATPMVEEGEPRHAVTHGVSHTTRRDETRREKEDQEICDKSPDIEPAPVADEVPAEGRPGEHRDGYFLEMSEGFAALWDGFPRRNGKLIGKAKAEQAWRRLKPADRRAALAALPNYAAARGDAHDLSACDPVRWLTGRQWEDWAEPEAPAVPAPRRRAGGHLAGVDAVRARLASPAAS
jgi:hypothetical protein